MAFMTRKQMFMPGRTLRGVGMTPEGIENNPVMYELVMELHGVNIGLLVMSG